MKVISERLGHSSITVTMDTYAHLLPAADKEAVATFDAAIHDPEGQVLTTRPRRPRPSRQVGCLL